MNVIEHKTGDNKLEGLKLLHHGYIIIKFNIYIVFPKTNRTTMTIIVDQMHIDLFLALYDT